MAKSKPLGRWKKTGNKLGEGGQAEVFEVTDLDDEYHGIYALKLISNPNRRTRLESEITSTRSLFSFGAPVLEIIDDFTISDVNADRPWFVTPIISGGNLEHRLPKDEPYLGSTTAALEFFRNYVKSLKLIHNHQIAHRDIKPENILMKSDTELLFCDLGLCFEINGDIGGKRTTAEDEQIGSRHYMPPEAFGTNVPNGTGQYAFDHYASGKILYRLISGRILPGFTSPTNEDYDLSKTIGGPFFDSLTTLLLGLLNTSPETRIQSWARIDVSLDLLSNLLNPSDPDESETEELERLLTSVSVPYKMSSREEMLPDEVGNELRDWCLNIAEDIANQWESDKRVSMIKERWLDLGSGDVSFVAKKGDAQFGSLLEGIYVKSRKGVQPLRQAGWMPKAPDRVDVLVGLQAQPSSKFASVYLASTIFLVDQQCVVLLMPIRRESGSSGRIDIIGPVQKLTGEIYDIGYKSQIQRAVSEHADRWVEDIQSELRTHISQQ